MSRYEATTKSHKATSRSLRRIAIIGAGDVVVNRLIGGLLLAGISPLNITIFDLFPGGGNSRERRKAEILERLRKSLNGSAQGVRIEFGADPEAIGAQVLVGEPAVFISCPSRDHHLYLEMLNKTAVPFAIEKPLVIDTRDIAELRQRSDLMRHGFALSYYSMEKALPLIFLLRPKKNYLKFLELDLGGADVCGSFENSVNELRWRLGALKRIAICLHEGEDSRSWTYDSSQGGLYFETLFHPLMLWWKILRLQMSVASETGLGRIQSRTEWMSENPTNHQKEPSTEHLRSSAPTYVDLRLRHNSVSGHLSCGKNLATRACRRARIEFEHGVMTCNFGSPLGGREEIPGAVARVFGREAMSVRLQEKYAVCRYGVLVERFMEFIEQGGTWDVSAGARYDEFEDQLPVLEFLRELCESRVQSVMPYSCGDPGPELARRIEDAERAARGTTDG